MDAKLLRIAETYKQTGPGNPAAIKFFDPLALVRIPLVCLLLLITYYWRAIRINLDGCSLHYIACAQAINIEGYHMKCDIRKQYIAQFDVFSQESGGRAERVHRTIATATTERKVRYRI